MESGAGFEELYSLYRSLNTIRLIKSRRFRWTEHAVRIPEGVCVKF